MINFIARKVLSKLHKSKLVCGSRYTGDYGTLYRYRTNAIDVSLESFSLSDIMLLYPCDDGLKRLLSGTMYRNMFDFDKKMTLKSVLDIGTVYRHDISYMITMLFFAKLNYLVDNGKINNMHLCNGINNVRKILIAYHETDVLDCDTLIGYDNELNAMVDRIKAGIK